MIRYISLNEPIDLLNVAFENPRKVQLRLDGNIGALPKKKKKQHLKMIETDSGDNTDGRMSSYIVPDRTTGLQEVEELRRLCPGRVWNFVSLITESYTWWVLKALQGRSRCSVRGKCRDGWEDYVSYGYMEQDSRAARSTVEAIMYPSRTVMDLVRTEYSSAQVLLYTSRCQSLASALYFASRGIGRVRDDPTSEYRAYTSPAKVVLSGLGSDEMLGGYGRHRSIFTTKGWQGVIDEVRPAGSPYHCCMNIFGPKLQLELDRIPIRNLGRDDRIISSHGKEARQPFLSLSVVSFLAGLPVHLKLDPRLDIGIGDKILLRLAARKVGLVEASMRKKRAMQFGSHSARMEGGEEERKGDTVIKPSCVR